jgi:hypothetical protein
MNRNYKDVTIKDGAREIRVRVFKMDSVSALNWMTKLCVVLANAGVPLPKHVATSVKELGAMLAKFASEGNVFRMPGLTVGAIQELWSDLLPFAFVIGKQRDGKGPELVELTVHNLAGQFEEPGALLRLFSEVLGASLGFFGRVRDLMSRNAEPLSSSPGTGTSTRS